MLRRVARVRGLCQLNSICASLCNTWHFPEAAEAAELYSKEGHPDGRDQLLQQHLMQGLTRPIASDFEAFHFSEREPQIVKRPWPMSDEPDGHVPDTAVCKGRGYCGVSK